MLRRNLSGTIMWMGLLTLAAVLLLGAGAETLLAQEAGPTAEVIDGPAGVDQLGDDGVEPVILDAEVEAAAAVSAEMFTVNNLWLMIAAALVFIMHLGFGSLEAGLTQAKNTVNILTKNTMIVCIGILTYALCGFNLMYPGFEDGTGHEIFGFAGPWLSGPFGEGMADQTAGYADGNYTYYTDFLFQAMFAATAATIVSGAVAGRVRLGAFLIYATIFVAIAYPIAGSWKWGYGWLHDLGFYDFAGSSIVHGFGGGGALAAAWILGPRLGKYAKDGGLAPIPGHNMPLAFIGVMMLWLGWFGFNGGSVLSADPDLVSRALVTTCIAAASGAIAAYFVTRLLSGKPDLSMILNGILAGLVGITAGADTMGPTGAALVGLIAGVIVVFSVYFFDKIRIDDPVGAISVHGVCGIWGTLAVGIFGSAEYLGTTANDTQVGNILIQLIGTLSYVIFAFVVTAIICGIFKAMGYLRVSEEEEIEGLDLGEHDMSAYPDFQRTYIKSYHAREI